MSKPLLRISGRRSSSEGRASGGRGRGRVSRLGGLLPRGALGPSFHLLLQVGVPKERSRTASGAN